MRPGSRGLSLGCGLTLIFGLGTAAAGGLGDVTIDNWGDYQKNVDGAVQWKVEPRLYLPYRFDNGVTFTQRIDLPLIYTNSSGAGNPDGGYSGGIGDVFIEEYIESSEIAKNLSLKASVRFVFPTGKQTPFGNSQYQWGPAVGLVYKMPEVLEGVTLVPYVRYLSGFSPQVSGVKEVRKLELYPAATLGLGSGWSLLLYPENPITYNAAKKTWFVPIDLLVNRELNDRYELGLGGAWRVGNSADPSFRYIVDARLIVHY